MLSDDSSSDSETGRFKSSKTERSDANKQSSRPPRGSELLPDLARSRNNGRSFGREFERRDEPRNRFDRRNSRDRYNSSRRYSPPRRRHSRDRSRERIASSRYKDDHYRSRDRDRDKRRSENGNTDRNKKKSQSPGSSAIEKRSLNESSKKSIDSSELKRRSGSRSSHKDDLEEKMPHSHAKLSDSVPMKERSLSKEKEVHRSKNRRYSTMDEISDVEEPASYYNAIPVIIEKSQEDIVHSVTDSSEDEVKLRAKLLNLERELDKSRKKKVKKSKKKSKLKHKDKDEQVEVSSTTDIQEKELEEKISVEVEPELSEVSSTQARAQKDASEEGEICTDDECTDLVIDPSDLRHKLKKSTVGVSGSPDQTDGHRSRSEVAGPALPPHMQAKREDRISPGVEGPQLPPHLRRKTEVGPSIPDDLRKKLAEAEPLDLSSSEDEGIGPLPQGAQEKWTDAHNKLEERALRMKIDELEGGSTKSDVKAREEWMLELPEAKAKHIGLGPRQFRAREGPDMSDRSSWTDTPQQKALKAAGVLPPEEASTTALQQEARRRYVEERDKDQEKAIKKHKKKHKREESLLDIHQKKLKKKKKKEEKEGEEKARRPFDRDVDLQANRFDDAQKRSIIKKAQHLDSRFSAGQAKFL